MANNDKDEQALNDYLDGNSALSQRYRESGLVEPPSHLDEKILSAATQSTRHSAQNTKFVLRQPRWVKPVSIAAIITLSISLVVTMQQQTGKPLVPELADGFNGQVLSDGSVMSKSSMINEPLSVMRDDAMKQQQQTLLNTAPATSGAIIPGKKENILAVPKSAATSSPMKSKLSGEKTSPQVLEKRIESKSQTAGSMFTEMDTNRGIENDNRTSLIEAELLKIKKICEEGELARAKQAYEDFTKDNPGINADYAKKILGNTVYHRLIN